MTKTKHSSIFPLIYIRSQSSIDSTNGFAFVPHVPHDVNKDPEQKSMRDLRNDIIVKIND